MIKKYYGNELYHHGIEGQKWGKRNGPPYPLGFDMHSAAEKAANATKTFMKKTKQAANATKTLMKKTKQAADNATEYVKTKSKEYKEHKAVKIKMKEEADAKKKRESVQKAIAEGDVDFARKHPELFTRNEYNEVFAKRQTVDSTRSKTKSEIRQEAKVERTTKNVQEAIANGDLKYAQKHYQDFTYQQMNDVINKYNTMTKLNDMIDPPKKTVTDYINSVTKGAGSVNGLIEGVTKLYNSTGKIVNTINKVSGTTGQDWVLIEGEKKK